jgi:hypothetical protein
LGPALCETLENVDGVIDLSEEVVGFEPSVAISASLEDDPSFSASKDV